MDRDREKERERERDVNWGTIKIVRPRITEENKSGVKDSELFFLC